MKLSPLCACQMGMPDMKVMNTSSAANAPARHDRPGSPYAGLGGTVLVGCRIEHPQKVEVGTDDALLSAMNLGASLP